MDFKTLKKIKLFIYDFDGVMTNNKVYIDSTGNEIVQVNRSDGLGVAEIKKLGYEQLIISSEKNSVVSARAEKLNIPYVQGVSNKKRELITHCKINKLMLKNVAFIGNDLNDYEAMIISGYSFCPADAHVDIIRISKHKLTSKGGQGVVRELLDLIKNSLGE